jgi:cation diffusion facilitator CzcD-associated flavoprotein CzcO
LAASDAVEVLGGKVTETNTDYEVIVIGAGVAGIYQIKRLVDLKINAVVFEADDGLGGTWYRNRYPGARFDSESYTYGYSFSQEVLDEWHWQERFSSQPENLRYLNFVADKFNLKQHMRFNARVAKMVWSEPDRCWQVSLETGETFTTKIVVTGVGVLSIPTPPNIPGRDQFKGESFHTYWWPKEPVSLAGKKVGIIGTGATGIQVIAEIADKVGELTVFQRRPNWTIPLNNSEISESEMAEIRSRYDEIFKTCAMSRGGFDHLPDPRSYYDVSEQERRELWDELYDERPGFALLIANFPEVFLDDEANQDISNYVAERIRRRVKDPVTAEKLIPKDHGFGMQRLPLETNYFEAYNRDNVQLVDLSETPIEEINASGVKTSDAQYDFDVLIYATGFDAITGALDRIDIQGPNGSLSEKYEQDTSTYIGVMTHGFPNLLMVAGPQSVSGSTNYPRAIETGVDWVTEFLEYVWKNGYSRFEPSEAGEAEWQQEVHQAHERMPFRRSKSWFTGYNSNLAHRQEGVIRHHAYWGGAPRYRRFLEVAAAEGYSQIEVD